MTLRPLFALSLVALLAPGCAETTAFTRVAPAQAVLEVVNRTPRELTISVRGRVEGVVPSGARARFSHFERGPAELLAVPTERSDDAAPLRDQRDLGARPIDVWELVDAANPLPVPAPLTDLAVVNPTRRAVAVALDGRRVAHVFAGETRVLRDLPATEHTIAATSDDGAFSTSATLALTAQGPNTWSVAFAGAHLEIINDTDEPVQITLDGVPRGTIAVGGALRSDDELPGPHLVSAVATRSRRPWDTTLELSAEAPTTWRLTSGDASLVVHNESGEAIAVTAGAGAPVSVESGARTELTGLPPGSTAVSGVGAATGARYTATVVLATGQRYTWTVRPVRPTLRIVNRTPQTLVAYVAGERRGELAPGASVLIAQLPAGAFTAEAIESRGTRRYVNAVDPVRTPASTWVVWAVTGSVTVVNDRPEHLDLGIDGRPLGEVDGRSERTFGGVPVGERLLEARGRRSGAVLRTNVEVSEETAARARFEDPTATLEVANTLGVALRTTGSLADQHAVVAPGATLRFAVSARTTTWVLLGDDGVPVSFGASPTAGEVVRWEVRPATTTLVLSNQLVEEVAIAVDDRAVGTVAAGTTGTFGDVPAGRRRFTAVGVTSGRARSLVQVASGDALVKWTLATRSGRILVTNGSSERVQVEIDGRLYDAVEPGATRAFADIAPTPHVVAAFGDTSGTRHAFEVQVAEGADAVLTVPAPMGALVVDNQSGQDVEVRVDGVVIGRVSAGAGPTSLGARAGKRLVQVERLGDRSVTGSEVVIAAYHAVHLPVPRAAVRLVLVNQTAGPLTVRLGDRTLATVAADSSQMIEDLPPGLADLTATDAAARVTQVERRTLYAGETATWVLQTAP